MKNYLDPIDAVTAPRENLIRYLLTSYPLRDPHLRYGFKQLLEKPGNIYQQAYLEGSQPYRPGSTITGLIEEGLLHPRTAALFNLNRPLYEHQEKAIRAVVGNDENIIVATGTGSGKTECFLIPMLDYLLKNRQSGVQALILYPMNALVNDQVKRLRGLLCHQDKSAEPIRFGFYTSRTPQNTVDAADGLMAELKATDTEELRQLLGQDGFTLNLSRREDLVREVAWRIMRVQAISREEIWDKPPQILITNYSMLEHMLIRPKERECIFERARNFKYLIVDEAHSYNGSTGAEVSMLLRRLRVAVGVEEPGRLRAIATSASLGDSRNPNAIEQVKSFAGELLGEPFQQVIWGDRVTVSERLGSPYSLDSSSTSWEGFYHLELPAITDNIDRWREQLINIVPIDILDKAIFQSGGDVHKFLWYALHQHPTIQNLINILAKEPTPWKDITQQLWADARDAYQSEVALSHLVQLGCLARENPEDLPLLPVRLHLLFRSIDGLYACINQQCPEKAINPAYKERSPRYGKLFLTNRDTCDCCYSPVLELSSCRKCGQAYTLAYLKLGDGNALEPLPRSLEGIENNSGVYVLTSGDLDSITEDEPEENQEAPEPSIYKPFHIVRDGKKLKGYLEGKTNSNSEVYTLQAYNLSKEKGRLDRCPACNCQRTHATAIRRFVSYTDAPLEVMLDSLFELLPEPESSSRASKRKLLTFSDGRQDAAFFASDFQRTHTETLYRQLVWYSFQQVQENGIASVNQVQERLAKEFLKLSIPHPDRESEHHHKSYIARDSNEDETKNERDCQQRANKRAKELLLREFGLPSARRFSIESLGLLACHLTWPDDFLEEVKFEFNLNNAVEAKIFLIGLTHIIRLASAVDLEGASLYFPETGGVEGGKPASLDSNGRSESYLKLQVEENNRWAINFLPRTTASGEPGQRQNAIVSYYRNFLGKYPPNESLYWLFNQLLNWGFLTNYQDGRQLHWELLNLYDTEQDWYRCNKCQQIYHLPDLSQVLTESSFNVGGCLAPRCEGKLSPFQKGLLNDDHYRHIIQKRHIIPLRSQEHTAQLSTEELASRESRFRQGKINLLSSSTTLEMGVDIGELQAVALRNFPPYVSNYQQRAGRAGRRTDGVAITLMYGQRKPHDRYYFEKPTQLINGQNRVPKIYTDHFEIQKRHIRAELLAQFLRGEINAGAEKVTMMNFLGLTDKSKELETIPPGAMIHKLIRWFRDEESSLILTRRWLTRLKIDNSAEFVLEDFEKALINFQKDQLRDWNALAKLFLELRNAVRDAEDNNESKKQRAFEVKRDRAHKELELIQKRKLHGELAKAGILPIYGFPIDVVRLLTQRSQTYGGSPSGEDKHRLERDRRIALGEYAPGQDVVVDDRVYTSVGIMRPESLSTGYYWVCQCCNYFITGSTKEKITGLLKSDNDRERCPTCADRPSPNLATPRPYKIPRDFTTDWSKSPKVTAYDKPLRQLVSQVFLAREGSESIDRIETSLYHLTLCRGGNFFLSNQGHLQDGSGFKNKGFAICRQCGRDLSDKLREKRAKNSKGKNQNNNSRQIEHTHPVTGRPCSGWYENFHLGHEFSSDFLKIRFTNSASLLRLYGANTPENKEVDFWRSLIYALLAASARVIDAPRSEIDGLFRPVENGGEGQAEIIIYDNVPGGAGYSSRIASAFPEVLQETLTLVNTCSCGSSCYDCLRTYTNQTFHDRLDRVAVSNFLNSIIPRETSSR